MGRTSPFGGMTGWPDSQTDMDLLWNITQCCMHSLPRRQTLASWNLATVPTQLRNAPGRRGREDDGRMVVTKLGMKLARRFVGRKREGEAGRRGSAECGDTYHQKWRHIREVWRATRNRGWIALRKCMMVLGKGQKILIGFRREGITYRSRAPKLLWISARLCTCLHTARGTL